MIIFVDIDGVVADLHKVWFERYNRDYKDDLMEMRVLSWDLHQYVKIECGKNIYTYLLDRHLYDTVEPVEDAVYYINKLRRDGHRVVFVTTSPWETMGTKFEWLNKHGFEVSDNDYVEAKQRRFLRGDILLDDNLENCQEFHGYGAVYDKPWNQGKYPLRVKDWAEFYKYVKSYRSGEDE
jgi:5'(3')-deoxyribonucleotidase